MPELLFLLAVVLRLLSTGCHVRDIAADRSRPRVVSPSFVVTGTLMAGMAQIAAAERPVVIASTGLYAVSAAAVLGAGVLRHGCSLKLTRLDVWSAAAGTGGVCVWLLVDSAPAAVLIACSTIVAAMLPAVADLWGGVAGTRLTSGAMSGAAGVAAVLAIGSSAIADIAVAITVPALDFVILALAARHSVFAVRTVGRPRVADAAEAC